jgi:CRP-like cAMP-binding protein
VPQLEEISFEVRQVLYDQDKPIDYVYFPLTGVFSLVVVLQDGTMVEAATT